MDLWSVLYEEGIDSLESSSSFFVDCLHLFVWRQTNGISFLVLYLLSLFNPLNTIETVEVRQADLFASFEEMEFDNLEIGSVFDWKIMVNNVAFKR